MAIKTIKRKIIYTTLVIVFLSGLISLSVVGLVTYNRTVKEQEANVRKITKEQASKVSIRLEASQDLAKHIANSIEISEWVKHPDEISKQNILSFLEHFNINNHYSAIYLLNTDGTVLASTDQTLDGKNYGFRDYFKSSLAGKPFIDMAIGVTTGQPGYYFSHPIIDESKNIIGVVAAKMSPDILSEVLKENYLALDGKIMLTDKNGIILYSNIPERVFQSLGQIDGATMAEIKTKKTFGDIHINPLQYDDALILIKKGITETTSIKISDQIDGEKELLTISPVKDSPFFLIVESSFDQLMSAAVNLSLILGLLVLFSTIIAILWISIFTKRALEPLTILRAMAENLGRGLYPEKNPIKSGDDLEELGDTFTKMSLQLKNYYGNLEQNVRERTGELEIKNKFLEDAKKAMTNILEDVELEKNKTANLAKDLEKFKLALDNASDHIIITNIDGIVLYANKGVEKITGYKVKEVVGKKAGQLWRLPMPKDFYEKLWKTIKTDKKNYIGEIRNKRKNGEEYDAYITISPVLSREKIIEFFVGIERDITHEKEVDRAKTEFVSLASHQLRTPLSSINWYTEMLLAGDGGKLNEEQAGFAKEIYAGNQRMVELVNALLNVSRLELGTFAVDPEPTDIVKIAKEVFTELRPDTDAKKLKMNFEYDKKIPIISADPKLIRIILQNLLSNSVKYTPEKGEVKLILGHDDKNILITVSDNGYGITKGQQDKIFTKLFRADNVREKDTEGTGLGLYIIKSIVDHSGGTIRFESEENKGTSFFLSLPIAGMKKKIGTKNIS